MMLELLTLACLGFGIIFYLIVAIIIRWCPAWWKKYGAGDDPYV